MYDKVKRMQLNVANIHQSPSSFVIIKFILFYRILGPVDVARAVIRQRTIVRMSVLGQTPFVAINNHSNEPKIKEFEIIQDE